MRDELHEIAMWAYNQGVLDGFTNACGETNKRFAEERRSALSERVAMDIKRYFALAYGEKKNALEQV